MSQSCCHEDIIYHDSTEAGDIPALVWYHQQLHLSGWGWLQHWGTQVNNTSVWFFDHVSTADTIFKAYITSTVFYIMQSIIIHCKKLKTFLWRDMFYLLLTSTFALAIQVTQCNNGGKYDWNIQHSHTYIHTQATTWFFLFFFTVFGAWKLVHYANYLTFSFPVAKWTWVILHHILVTEVDSDKK